MDELGRNRKKWSEEEKKNVVGDYSNYLEFRDSGVSREEVVQRQKELEAKYKISFPSIVATASRELRKQKREEEVNKNDVD